MNLTTHDIRVLTERFAWAVAAGVRPADWIRLHAKLDTNELNALFTELRREWAEFGHDDGTMDALKAASAARTEHEVQDHHYHHVRLEDERPAVPYFRSKPKPEAGRPGIR